MQTELEFPAGFSTVYRAGQRRARVATLLLGSVAFVTFLLLMHEIAGLGIIEEARAGTLTQANARDYDNTGALLGIGYALAYLVAAVGYLAWLSRTVDNAPVLGAGRPSVTPRWSIGWWFVPFANLVKPLLIVTDVHQRMATAAQSGGAWILIAWWVVSVGGNFIDTINLRLPEPQTLDEFSARFTASAVSDVITLVAVALAILVIRRIQSRADERASTLTAEPAPAVAVAQP